MKVDHHTPTRIIASDSGSTTSLPGRLGVGLYNNGRTVFGEVELDSHGVPSFTHRSYYLDQLDLERFNQEGLVLDAGDPTTGEGRLFVSPEDLSQALSQLPRPVAQLQVGDSVAVLRNRDHPAWMEPDNGPDADPDEPYVLPSDFEPLVTAEAVVTDRRADQIRVNDQHWYNLDGKQAASAATLLVSQTSLAGTRWQSPQLEAAAAAISARLTEVTVRLDEQLTTLEDTVAQWNPHNPKQVPRIERFQGHVQQYRQQIAELTGSGIDGASADPATSAEDASRVSDLEQLSEDLEQDLRKAGVRRRGTSTGDEAGRRVAGSSFTHSFDEPVVEADRDHGDFGG